jgi:hypothetical protein
MNRNQLNKVSLDTDNLITRRIFAFNSNNQPLSNNYILAISNSEAHWVDTLRNIETYPGVGYLPDTLVDICGEIRAVSNYFTNNLSISAEQLGFVNSSSFSIFSNSVCNDISQIKYAVDASFNQLDMHISNIVGGTIFMNDLCNLETKLLSNINNISNNVPNMMNFVTLSNYTVDISNNLKNLSNYTINNFLQLNSLKVSCNDFNAMLNDINDISGSVKDIYMYTYGTRLLLSNNINDLSNNIKNIKNKVEIDILDLSGRILNESGVTSGQFNGLVNSVNLSNNLFNSKIGILETACNSLGSIASFTTSNVILNKNVGSIIDGSAVTFSSLNVLTKQTLSNFYISNSSLILNGNSASIEAMHSNSFYVKPIRSSSNSSILYYDSSTGEITHSTAPATSSTLPTATQESSYLYYNGSQWVVGTNNIRLGTNAGSTSQGFSSIAIGNQAGKKQGFYSIALGVFAGCSGNNNNTQGDKSVAIGYSAGYQTMHNNSIAINASDDELNTLTSNAFYVKPIRNLSNSSMLYYNSSSGEITYSTAPTTSSSLPTATINGSYLYYNDSQWVVGTNTIKIGTNAGNTLQGSNAIAIGNLAGISNQGNNSVAIGNVAGWSNQDSNAVALGNYAGYNQQSIYAIAIGSSAGYSGQSLRAVAIGTYAGGTSQGSNAIAIGYLAGHSNQHTNSIIINATGAAYNSCNANAFYVKPIRNASNSSMLYYNSNTGEITHSNVSITLPTTSIESAYLYYSDNTWQVGTSNVRLGANSGSILQGNNSIAVGNNAGTRQGTNCIAIGDGAGIGFGSNIQGNQSVAIGYLAGHNVMHDNSIAINATDGTLNTTTSNAFYVAPIRNTTVASRILMYNNLNSEINTFSSLHCYRYSINGSNQIIWDGIFSTYKGWPHGTPVSNLNGILGTNNNQLITSDISFATATSDSGGTSPRLNCSNVFWNAPISGLWQIGFSLIAAGTDNAADGIAIGNITKSQLFGVNDSTSTIYIEQNDKILIAGHKRGSHTVQGSNTINPAHLISMTLIMPMQLSPSYPTSTTNYTSPEIS